MLASGNSSVTACAHNLLSAMQREIPFARSKGLDPDVYDAPFEDVRMYLDETARDTLEAYEKRVNVDEIDLQFYQAGDDDGTYFMVEISDADGDINDDDEGGDE